jgi:hypothetical protein
MPDGPGTAKGKTMCVGEECISAMYRAIVKSVDVPIKDAKLRLQIEEEATFDLEDEVDDMSNDNCAGTDCFCDAPDPEEMREGFDDYETKVLATGRERIRTYFGRLCTC